MTTLRGALMRHGPTLGTLLLAGSAWTSEEARLELLLPLGRTAYQTNEWIELSVAAAGADGSLSLYGPDGKTLVACTSQQAHVVVDGKVAHRVGGVSGGVDPVRSGDEIVLSGGNDKVLFLSPALGRVVRQVTVAKGGVVSLSGSVAGTEADGGVWGLAGDRVAWEHRAALRLTKKVAARDGAVGVAYWGGTVHLLDGAGALKAAHWLPSDVADVAWVGNRLVVSQADGSLLALEVK